MNVDGLMAFEDGNYSGVVVSKSSHVTLDHDNEQQNYTYSTGAAVSISGASSDVTVSRNWVTAYSSSGGVYVNGGSGDVITTSILDNFDGPAAALVGAPSSDVTSNFISVPCKAGISLTSGSSSASVQNNVGVYAGFAGYPTSHGCPVTTATQVDLLADSSSTSGSTEGYNDLATNSTSIPAIYSWAGVGYATPAAFTAATGQGTQDVDSTASAYEIDSANSAAPGE